MLLRKIISIFKFLHIIEIQRMKSFKVDFFFVIISKILFLSLNIFFWGIMGKIGYSVPGWQSGDLIVFIAFSELFYGLDRSIFSVASRFWRYIYSGLLDVFLVRPLDPKARFIMLNISYVDLYASIVEFLAIIILANRRISILKLFIGVAVVIIANIVLAEIRLIASYLAFWHGKMDAVSEICDSLVMFNKYPLCVLDKNIIVIVKILFPFYFFSTFSSEIVNFDSNLNSVGIALLGIVFNVVIWSRLNHFLWLKGLEKYESVNG